MPVPVETQPDETQTDSESTEDEIELNESSYIDGLLTRDTRDNATSSAPPLAESNMNEILVAANKFLEKLSDNEANDCSTHDSIIEAVDYIAVFIESLLSRSLISDNHSAVIPMLLSDSFMSRLFDLRAIFRGIAASEAPPRSKNVTIICWADDLLVKICACILHLATHGAMRDLNKVVGVQSLKTMQDSEALKAAAQLPVKFGELVNALTSKYSSPAMSRMALTLLYGTRVLRGHFQEMSHEFNSSQIDDELVSAMSARIIKYGVDASEESPNTIYPPTLVEYTMSISLYIQGVGATTAQSETPFAPHTEHAIVDLISIILDHAPREPEPADPWSGPPTMLVNDLALLDWFWKRWGDGSTSIAAVTLKLTQYWIQHYRPHNTGLSHVDVLLASAPHSFQTILHLIDASSTEAPTVLPLSPSESTIVKRVCEAYEVLASSREPDDLRYERVLAEACKRIGPYILVPSQDGLNDIIWELVIKLLVSVGPSAIRAAYGDAAQVQFRWNNEGLVEKALQAIATIIDERDGSLDIQSSWTEAEALKLKYLLDFLVVLMHANACFASAVISSATFLPKLVPWISKPFDKRLDFDVALWNILRASTFMLVGFSYSQFKICCSALTNRFPEFDLDGFVDVVLDDEKGCLLETCALACYMVATEADRMLDDPVVILVIWSRLRDVLLGTLQHRFVDGDEAISIAASGTICASLVSILSSTGKLTRGMILASPWTQTLQTELRKVLDGHKPRDDVGLGLHRQLDEVGKIILNVIDHDTKPASMDTSLRLVCADGGGWLQVVPMLLF